MDSTHLRRASRGAAAALSVAAITLGGLALAAPANAAENDVIAASGSLDWGYKTSFRNYVTGTMNPLGADAIQVADGAQRSGTDKAAGFLFPVAAGNVADADNLTIATGGSASFNFPSHFFTVSLSDIKVVVEDGVASIIADTYLKADMDFGDIATGTYEADDVRIAEAGAAEITVADGTVTVSGTGVTLTAEGAAANPLYPAGSELDSFSVTAELEAGATEPEPEPGTVEDIEVTVPEVTTEPEPETGSFGWEWAGTSPVSLGTATQQNGSFVAAGALNDIVVTDTRAGGTNAYRWELTGSVSDFVAGSDSFAASALGWTPSVSNAGAGVVAGPAVQSLATPALLATSGAAASATVSAALNLTLPTSTPAGDYTATVTITAVG